MINANFAPNENWDDAWLSLKLIFQPWRWQYGQEIEEIKEKIIEKFHLPIPIINFRKNSQHPLSDHQFQTFLFLTGRSALFTILQSLSLPPNSEVIVQAFTCEAVILPILANKLKPIYTDIETKTLSINPVELEKKITNKTKVVILQHTFGMTPLQKEKIQLLVKKHGLVLIEDIAHGYSIPNKSGLNSKPKTQNLNLVYLLSFGRSKAISSVFGGAAITNNHLLIKKLSHFGHKSMPSAFFILRLLLYKPLSVLIKSTYDIYIGKIIHRVINLINILVPEISSKEKAGEYDDILDKAYPNALAILLLHQLNKFDQTYKHRALICEYYRKNLHQSDFDTQGLSLIRYPVLVKEPQKVLLRASKQNIFLGNWYNQVVAPKSLDLKKIGYQKGNCPNAEKICQQIINLPVDVCIKDAKKIIDKFLRINFINRL